MVEFITIIQYFFIHRQGVEFAPGRRVVIRRTAFSARCHCRDHFRIVITGIIVIQVVIIKSYQATMNKRDS